MKFLFGAVMMESMTGWIEMWVSPTLYPRMLAAGLATYAVVAILEYRRIIRGYSVGETHISIQPVMLSIMTAPKGTSSRILRSAG